MKGMDLNGQGAVETIAENERVPLSPRMRPWKFSAECETAPAAGSESLSSLVF